MAPEIALKEPYDKEADVFSFSMLLWEITSMEFLYPGYTIKDYYVRVVKNNERPTIPKKKRDWHPVIKAIVQEGWDRKPQNRPNMKRVGLMIRGLLQDIYSDDSILHRSTHMMDKSHRSLHNTPTTQDKASVHPMMENSSNSGMRRIGGVGRNDRPSQSVPTGTTATKTMAINNRKESYHQNLDERELND
jgi:hypothetical protein